MRFNSGKAKVKPFSVGDFVFAKFLTYLKIMRWMTCRRAYKIHTDETTLSPPSSTMFPRSSTMSADSHTISVDSEPNANSQRVRTNSEDSLEVDLPHVIKVVTNAIVHE